MFYKGTVAEENVKAVKGEGGTLEDVKGHGEMGSEEVAPNGFGIWGGSKKKQG